MQSCTDLPIYRFTLLKQEWHRDQIYGGRILAHSKQFSDLYLQELAAVSTGNLSFSPLQFGKENTSTTLYWKTKKASPLLLQNGLHMSEFIWWYKLLSINLTRLPKAFLVPKKGHPFEVNKRRQRICIYQAIHTSDKTTYAYHNNL